MYIYLYTLCITRIGISETRLRIQKERESAHKAINERFEGVGDRFSLRASDAEP